MFTGIVDCCSPVLNIIQRDQVLEISIGRPSNFKDIKEGDSVSVDGVCLTIEKYSEKEINFALGKETLLTTGWNANSLKDKQMNLELSLRASDRIGGDFVTGHVDGVAEVIKSQTEGENQYLWIKLPKGYESFIWNKGFITLSGVNLTVHEVSELKVKVSLIPETLKRTNLSQLCSGHRVTFEVSSLAKALVNYLEKNPKLTK